MDINTQHRSPFLQHGVKTSVELAYLVLQISQCNINVDQQKFDCCNRLSLDEYLFLVQKYPFFEL
jgi:hypothetical protein